MGRTQKPESRRNLMEMRGCFVKLRLRKNYQEKREDIKLNKGGENFFFNGQ